MSERDFEWFRELDAELLAAEEQVAEQKKWLEHDTPVTDLAQVAFDGTVTIESPLL